MVFFSSRFPGFSRGLLLFSPLVFSQFSPRFRVLVNAEALGPLKKVRKVALRRGWCYSPSGFFWVLLAFLLVFRNRRHVRYCRHTNRNDK